MKLVIVDYGMGNITSIISALKFVGQDNVVVSNDIHTLSTADRLILPGVGNFATAIGKINEENETIIANLKSAVSATEINEYLFKKGIVLSHLVKRKPSLEQQFLDLTNSK